MIDFRRLVQAGVHFGHKTSRWHPKMAPFIWGYKNNIHLINVAKTAQQMEAAAQFLESIAAEKKTILWVGTKKVSQPIIDEIGKRLNCPYVIHRWIGGTLTNYSQVKKSITKLLHYEDILAKAAKAEQPMYTKKEIGMLQKAYERLQKNVGTIRNFTWPIGAVVLVDVKKEQTALREAKAQGVPIVALVDTNCDPSVIDYVIPGNDDATSAIKEVMTYLADAVENGQKFAMERKEQEAIQESAGAPVQEMQMEEIAGAVAGEPTQDRRSKKEIKEEQKVKKAVKTRPVKK